MLRHKLNQRRFPQFAPTYTQPPPPPPPPTGGTGAPDRLRARRRAANRVLRTRLSGLQAARWPRERRLRGVLLSRPPHPGDHLEVRGIDPTYGGPPVFPTWARSEMRSVLFR